MRSNICRALDAKKINGIRGISITVQTRRRGTTETWTKEDRLDLWGVVGWGTTNAASCGGDRPITSFLFMAGRSHPLDDNTSKLRSRANRDAATAETRFKEGDDLYRTRAPLGWGAGGRCERRHDRALSCKWAQYVELNRTLGAAGIVAFCPPANRMCCCAKASSDQYSTRRVSSLCVCVCLYLLTVLPSVVERGHEMLVCV